MEAATSYGRAAQPGKAPEVVVPCVSHQAAEMPRPGFMLANVGSLVTAPVANASHQYDPHIRLPEWLLCMFGRRQSQEV